MSKFKFVLVSLSFAGLLLVSRIGQAESWPKWVDAEFPLIWLFSQDQGMRILGYEGFEKFPVPNTDRRIYSWIGLNDEWHTPRKCSDKVRSTGYIQSQYFSWTRANDKAITAVPVKIHINGNILSPSERDRTLVWPFLNVSIGVLAHEDPQKIYRSIDTKPVHLKKMCRTLDKGIPLNDSMIVDENRLDFNGICFADSFGLERGESYQIRIEWNGDAFCGENPNGFFFSIGSQFQILSGAVMEE